MTQQIKKNISQPAAKIASNIASKAAKDALAAVESTRDSAENVVKIGSAAVKDLLANGATEAQKVQAKVQEKVLEFGRESADKLAKSADVAGKTVSDLLEISRDNAEAAVELGNLTASFAKDISSEVFEYTNKAFSDNLETSKEFFACRTINEMVELQSKIIKNSLDSFLGETSKITNILFEYSSEALEPINERVAQASEQFSKTISSCGA